MLLLIKILSYLLTIFLGIMIVNFVLSLLVMFNVISPANDAVRAIQSSLNQVLDPILEPVRRFMPDTGAIDFSPIVIMAGIQILLWVLEDIARQV